MPGMPSPKFRAPNQHEVRKALRSTAYRSPARCSTTPTATSGRTTERPADRVHLVREALAGPASLPPALEPPFEPAWSRGLAVLRRDDRRSQRRRLRASSAPPGQGVAHRLVQRAPAATTGADPACRDEQPVVQTARHTFNHQHADCHRPQARPPVVRHPPWRTRSCTATRTGTGDASATSGAGSSSVFEAGGLYATASPPPLPQRPSLANPRDWAPSGHRGQ